MILVEEMLYWATADKVLQSPYIASLLDLIRTEVEVEEEED